MIEARKRRTARFTASASSSLKHIAQGNLYRVINSIRHNPEVHKGITKSDARACVKHSLEHERSNNHVLFDLDGYLNTYP
jgi:hypothetical protein